MLARAALVIGCSGLAAAVSAAWLVYEMAKGTE